MDAGASDRSGLIMAMDLPEGWQDARMMISSPNGRQAIPSQVMAGVSPRIYWRLPDSFPAETRTRYTLRAGASETTVHERVRLVDTGSSLQARVGGKAMFHYRKETVDPPAGVSLVQARNAYIHPVRSPSGAIVTGDFEPNGPHQRGIWNAWTRTEFRERAPDFWNLQENSGAIRFQSASSVRSGSIVGGFQVAHEHVDLSAREGPEPVILETWSVVVFPYDSFFVFEIDSLQRTASPRPLNLPEYHYGGMAYRGRMAWALEGAHFLTSEGLAKEEADGSRARWCAAWGGGEQGDSGMAILGHPDNFRFPQPLRIHTGYPYFAFVPQRMGSMAIQPGSPYRSRFRFVVFDGPADAELLERLWGDFADPAAIRIVDPDAERKRAGRSEQGV